MENKVFIEKKEVLNYIDVLMDNLAQIKDDTGDFLLDFDGLIVDDKSWNVWNWPQGVGIYGIYKFWLVTKNDKALTIVTDWFDARLNEGVPSKNVNTMAPILTLAYQSQLDKNLLHQRNLQ